MAKTHTKTLVVLVASAIALTACSAGPTARTVFSAEEEPDTVIDSVLIVGVAGTLNTRADFERALVSELRQQGIEAVAYHTVVKGGELSRERIEKAVSDQSVNGVVVTRETAREGSFAIREDQSSIKKTAKGGSLLNLYRYDYEEINDPTSIDVEFDVTLASDLYSVGNGLVWTGESVFTNEDNIALVIDSAAETIARGLLNSGFIGE